MSTAVGHRPTSWYLLLQKCFAILVPENYLMITLNHLNLSLKYERVVTKPECIKRSPKNENRPKRFDPKHFCCLLACTCNSIFCCSIETEGCTPQQPSISMTKGLDLYVWHGSAVNSHSHMHRCFFIHLAR